MKTKIDHVLKAIAENRAAHLCVDNQYFFLRYNPLSLKFAAALADFSEELHQYMMTVNIMMDMDELNRYNPNFDKVMATADNSYEMKLPAEKMESFVNNKFQILNDSVQMLLNSATASTASTNSTSSGK